MGISSLGKSAGVVIRAGAGGSGRVPAAALAFHAPLLSREDRVRAAICFLHGSRWPRRYAINEVQRQRLCERGVARLRIGRIIALGVDCPRIRFCVHATRLPLPKRTIRRLPRARAMTRTAVRQRGKPDAFRHQPKMSNAVDHKERNHRRALTRRKQHAPCRAALWSGAGRGVSTRWRHTRRSRH